MDLIGTVVMAIGGLVEIIGAIGLVWTRATWRRTRNKKTLPFSPPGLLALEALQSMTGFSIVVSVGIALIFVGGVASSRFPIGTLLISLALIALSLATAISVRSRIRRVRDRT